MDTCCHPLASGQPSADLALIFLTGVTVSLGHCLGMCGPLHTAFITAQSGARRVRAPLARYHGGRILGYVVIGALLGLAGTVGRWSGMGLRGQAVLSAALGGLLLVTALGAGGPHALESLPGFRGIGQGVSDWMRRLLSSPRGRNQFSLGLANGFLPCGPVLAVGLTAASSAHVAVGMLLMFVYGLGTLPALLLLAAVSSRIGPAARRRVSRAGTVLLVLLGIQLVLRGLAGLGAAPHLKLGAVVFW